MDKQQQAMIECIEEKCCTKLTPSEKSLCIMAFSYGQIEGFVRAEKIIKRLG